MGMRMLFEVSIVCLLALFRGCSTDTPANCTFDDIAGTWLFFEGERGQDASINCSQVTQDTLAHQSRFQLLFPNLVVDQFGNEGTWTIIYNQGFEVTVNSRKYFAFSNFTQSEHVVVSRCHETLPGFSHDVTARDWSCFVGRKTPQDVQLLKTHKHYEGFYNEDNEGGMEPYQTDHRMIEKINRIQKSWTAKAYAQFEGLTVNDIVRMAGGLKSRVHRKPNSRLIRLRNSAKARSLPGQFDWRNVSGINYVSPVRNQGTCGSCYAFASMAMLEARVKILTNNTQNLVFSPQDIIECSEYSQGCDGGFPYLIAGKYAEDFGVVTETCNPYNPPTLASDSTEELGGQTLACNTKHSCRRYYATGYKYLGGFYGGCNEALMKIELVQNGPFAVGFEVYDDFMHYSGGVYHHTGIRNKLTRLNKWNPFQLTNHAVLVVGYGVDAQTREAYWIVKNSWSESWGEKGYFRIRRGNDECGIESLAMASLPIPTY